MSSSTSVHSGLEELDRDECLRLIAHAPIGRLAVVVAGQPLVFPVNFVLDGDAVVFRTDRGTKLHGSRNGPVAFECDGIDGCYHTGWSVLVLAIPEQVTDHVEIARLETLPLAPWSPAPKPIWLRLRPRAISGRRIPQHAGVPVDVDENERVV